MSNINNLAPMIAVRKQTSIIQQWQKEFHLKTMNLVKLIFFQIKKTITFSFRPRAANLLNKRDKIKIIEAWLSEISKKKLSGQKKLILYVKITYCEGKIH
jgi:hypothetical protein